MIDEPNRQWLAREIRDFSIISRWGTVRLIRRGTVGEHSHRVAIYADLIADILEVAGSATRLLILRHALWHDAPEIFTGDFPGPVKGAVVDANMLAAFEQRGMDARFGSLQRDNALHVPPAVAKVVKLADLLDGILELIDDQRMGNMLLGGILEKCEAALAKELQATAGGEFQAGRWAAMSKVMWATIAVHKVTAARVIANE